MTDLIMPATCHNKALFEITMKALKSCKATCDAKVLYLANNDRGTEFGDRMQKEVEALGYDYKYIPGAFNMSRLFNLGFNITKGEYICYSNSDVEFFPGWLDALIEAWKEHPHFYSMHPYTFSAEHKGLNYRNDDCHPIKRVIPCDHPGAAGCMLMKRKDCHVWDERFTYWEHDAAISIVTGKQSSFR